MYISCTNCSLLGYGSHPLLCENKSEIDISSLFFFVGVIMKQINNWNEAEGSITVTLFKNPFKKEGFYGRVKRRTIKLDTIIGMIAQKNPGISEGLMQIVAGYMQKEILNLIGLGYCVNILELGTMYIAPKGSIDGAETNGISEVEPRFTPSDVLNEKVSKLRIETVLLSSSDPELNEIIDTTDLSIEKNTSVTTNRVARITGKKLKLGDEPSGIYFIPVTEDDDIEKDESLWVKVDSVITNLPKKLEFYVPSSLSESTKYVIAVKTSYRRQSFIIGYSEPISIKIGN